MTARNQAGLVLTVRIFSDLFLFERLREKNRDIFFIAVADSRKEHPTRIIITEG